MKVFHTQKAITWSNDTQFHKIREYISYWMGVAALNRFTKKRLELDVQWAAPMPSGPKIFACNHPTTTDPFYLLSVLPEKTRIMVNALIFKKPIEVIMTRILSDGIDQAWTRYLIFAIYVVGIGGGVRPWDIEKYLTQREPYTEVVKLTSDRWVLEIYQTIMGTLGSVAWLLLVFFVFALVAFVILRVFGPKKANIES